MFFVLALSINLFANEKECEFSLAVKKAERPQFDLDSILEKDDFLFSSEQKLQINLPKFYKANFSENSNFWHGVKKGALIGGAAGAVFFYASAESKNSEDSILFALWSPPEFCGFIGAVIGAAVGGIIGGIAEIIS